MYSESWFPRFVPGPQILALLPTPSFGPDGWHNARLFFCPFLLLPIPKFVETIMVNIQNREYHGKGSGRYYRSTIDELTIIRIQEYVCWIAYGNNRLRCDSGVSLRFSPPIEIKGQREWKSQVKPALLSIAGDKRCNELARSRHDTTSPIRHSNL